MVTARFRPCAARKRNRVKLSSSSSSSASYSSPHHHTTNKGAGDNCASNGDKNNDDDDGFVDIGTGARLDMISDVFLEPPRVRDPPATATATSRAQDETVAVCLPLLSGEDDRAEYNDRGIPRLRREHHLHFLRRALGPMPGGYVAADASRPWFLYWVLSAMAILGEDVTVYRDRVVATAASMQDPAGGFGGGPGQLAHLATTYAVVLALALVGGEDAYDLVDRRALWSWLCSLKQPDGGFQICQGGEEDIRGAYCATVIVRLLNLPLDLSAGDSPALAGSHTNLLSGLPDYVRRCQTFEGGISACPDAEAHGAYAFCALGCLSLLDHPHTIVPKYLNIPRLVAWLSSRQYAPEGGFSGRTNKLVDGCYSHWVGGCFPLIRACLDGGDGGGGGGGGGGGAKDKAGRPLPPVPEDGLFSREGLIRYIMSCCQDQSRRGGLRDKPGKDSDAYHTCYVLSGLSAAQYQWEILSPEEAPAKGETEPEWIVLPDFDDLRLFDQRDFLRPIHPVYAIPQHCQRAMRSYFETKAGF